MSMYTPGPWEAGGNDKGATFALDPRTGNRICTMRRCENDWGNALLVAAAPELLEALEVLLAYVPIPPVPMGADVTDPFPLPAYIKRARAAIAKATGAK